MKPDTVAPKPKTMFELRVNLVLVEFEVRVVNRRPDMKDNYVLDKYSTKVYLRVLWVTWAIRVFSIYPPSILIDGEDYKGK